MTFAAVFILSLLNTFLILPMLGVKGTAGLALGWFLGFANGMSGLWIHRIVSRHPIEKGIRSYFIGSAAKFLVTVGIAVWVILAQIVALQPFIWSLFVAYFTFMFYYVVTLKRHITT